MIMSVSAGLAAAAMSWGGIGRFPPASVLSVLALGPLLDLAVAGAATGWRLYLGFALAGGVANLLAFSLRAVISALGWDFPGGRHFQWFWSVALVSFLLCGALAGLVSAAACFRARGSDDLRRD
jgi:hypothetical protein